VNDPFSRLPDALVPLELAVRHIFKNVYGPVTSLDKLNGLAMAIAALATIFQSDKESTKLPRAIPASVAFSGMFRGGGKELRFVDGRAPLLALCMKAEDVSYVIGVLQQGMTSGDQAENTFGAPAHPTATTGAAD
jgi:hypothetical protein